MRSVSWPWSHPSASHRRQRVRESRACGARDRRHRHDQLAAVSLAVEYSQVPETLAEAGLGGFVDPWGNPYRYVNVATAERGDARRDRNSRPLNNDFDLYSMGPDGATGAQLDDGDTHDDIVRANNGQYIGAAEDLLR